MGAPLSLDDFEDFPAHIRRDAARINRVAMLLYGLLATGTAFAVLRIALAMMFS